MALANTKYSFDTLLLASILDGVNLRNWAMSEDAISGINRPQSMVNKLIGKEDDNSEEMTFDSKEEFEDMRGKLLGRR